LRHCAAVRHRLGDTLSAMSNGTPTIEGLALVPLRTIVDERGAVLHMLRTDAPDFRAFGECYFSEVNPGTVKGWKRHRRQTQNLAVPVGRVRFVLYDARVASVTRGVLNEVELGRPDAYARLHIPPMVFYGFICISDRPALVANCTDLPHDPDEGEVLALEALDGGRALHLLRVGAAQA
jgi:dTDP-4-dehydrorhamnose 3,5-epimerase